MFVNYDMTRIRLYILMLVLILLTIPWFFSGITSRIIVGFPSWALYTFIATLIFAIITSYILGKYWNLSARELEEEE